MSAPNRSGSRFDSMIRNRFCTKVAALVLVVVLLNLVFHGRLSSPNIEVYFSPQGGGEQAVLKRLTAARKTIDVAMYAFTSGELAEALTQARDKGVEVRVLLDSKFNSSDYSKQGFLSQGNVDLKAYQSPTGGLMHHKFAIVDRGILILGSYNWTNSAESRNCENLLILTRFPELTEKFQREFDRLWEKGPASVKEAISTPVIAATDLKGLRNSRDKAVVVEGQIREIGYSQRSDTYFLRFDVVRPCFTAVIFSSGVEKFRAQDTEPTVFKGKKVRLRGRLIDHPKYGLEIIVEDPRQIEEIVDETGK